MKTFKTLVQNLNEAFKAPAGEKVVKTLKLGNKNKVEAVITKKGSKFIAYVNGDRLDEFKSANDAEKSMREIADLMGQ